MAAASVQHCVLLLWRLLLLGRAATSHAQRFRTGDPLPVMKRSQFRGERSEWREVPHDACPRYEQPGVISLHALPADFASPGGGLPEYKMAFSFLNDQFQTPWITIADGRGQFLTHLVFTMEHAGDAVTDVRWQTIYGAPSEAPPHVQLEYEFVDAAEQDPRTALTALFVGGLVLSALSVLIAVGDSESVGPSRSAAAAQRRRCEDDA